jgi:hypothetical protein
MPPMKSVTVAWEYPAQGYFTPVSRVKVSIMSAVTPNRRRAWATSSG